MLDIYNMEVNKLDFSVHCANLTRMCWDSQMKFISLQIQKLIVKLKLYMLLLHDMMTHQIQKMKQNFKRVLRHPSILILSSNFVQLMISSSLWNLIPYQMPQPLKNIFVHLELHFIKKNKYGNKFSFTKYCFSHYYELSQESCSFNTGKYDNRCWQFQ